MPLSVVALLAALVCVLVLRLLLQSGWAWKIAVDIPNARSLHVRPVPRVGGVALLTAALPAIWILTPDLREMVLAILLVAGVSLLDDRIDLPIAVRMMAHATAVAIMLVQIGPHWPAWLLLASATGWIWMVNLYNFMDGSDGLAGGMAVFGFGTLALGAGAADAAGAMGAANATGAVTATSLALASAALAGAAAGFLTLNLQPARVFLGDAGSISLGFAAGAIGLSGWQQQVWPIWFPLLVFSPFIMDASVTLLRRLLHREAVWQAHRGHYYQRVIRLGLTHRRTALFAYALMLLAGGLALALLHATPLARALGMTAWGLLLTLLGLVIDRLWMRHGK